MIRRELKSKTWTQKLLFLSTSNTSLRTLLVVPFIIEIFAAVGLTGTLSFYNGQTAVNDLASQLRNEVTARIQERLQAYLAIPHQVNQLDVNAVELGTLNLQDQEQRGRYFWKQVQTFDLISHNYMATPDGQYFGAKRLQSGGFQTMLRNEAGHNQYFSVDKQGYPIERVKLAHNFDPRQRPWYQAALNAGKPSWSTVYPDFTTRGLAITAVHPLYHSNPPEEKALQAVFGASLILSWMDTFLGSLKIGKTGQTFIIERSGLLVASSTHVPVVKDDPVISDTLHRVYAVDSDNDTIHSAVDHLNKIYADLSDIRYSIQMDFKIDGQKQFLQITPLQDTHGLNWLIMVVVPEADFMERIHAITRATMGLFVVALGFGILGGVFTSRWVIRPIQALNTAAKSLAMGEWKQTVPARRKDELGELANSFNSMAQQLKESFDKLEKKNADLQKLDKLKDEFLANTSHELRTPLNGIIGIAESMCDGAVGPLSKPQRKNLLMIAQSGHRLTNLVNDILDFSKLKHKNIDLQLRPVGIREVTEVVLTLSHSLVGNKSLKLVNKVSNDLPPAQADENRLQQILHNLIGNAIKFTEQGRVEISAHIEKNKQSEYLIISVSDTGIGIPEDKLLTIFESFEQVDGGNARQYGGTGLGLTVTKQLVELHKGRIGVSSKLNKGSVFHFTLPVSEHPTEPHTQVTLSAELSRKSLANGTDIELAAPGQTAELDSLTHQGMRPDEPQPSVAPVHPNADQFTIMIVDDEPINLQVLVNHLSLQNYAVVQANNGPEALEFIYNNGVRPNLVLLDVMMPKMTGYEVCRRLRETFPANELPILLLTAKTQVSNLIEGLDAGANDYLTKPVAKTELLARIKTHLQISNLNIAYGRFVPHEFIQLMDKQSVVDVKLGDHIEKDMTILFSDIRGFTSISETMTPQENFDFINAYLSRMEPIIGKHQGFIDKYIGDAIMALFPVSVDQAVAAAVGMLFRLVEYNTTRGRPGRPVLKIGIGVHTGLLMMGTVGGENRMDGTVIADAVNLASRTEGLTKTYGVALLITEQVYKRLQTRDHYKIRVIDRVRVKGKTEAVTVYEIFDADPPEIVDGKLRTLEDFERGFHAYHADDLSTAHQFFEQVLAVNPGDKTAQLYLTRCQMSED